MKVLGFRLCTVSPEASNLAAFFDAIGFERHPLEGGSNTDPEAFTGAVFAAGESWLAMWPPGDMPVGLMLQVVVDDADAFAAHAREQGLDPAGPTDAQGKRIYFLQAPTGLQISIQSRIVPQTKSLPVPPPTPAWAKPAPPRAAIIAPPPARGATPLARAAQPGRTGSGAAPARPGAHAPPPLVPPPRAAGHSAPPPPPARASATPVAPPRAGAFRRAPR